MRPSQACAGLDGCAGAAAGGVTATVAAALVPASGEERVGQVRGRILTYHRVDDVKGDRLVVSPDQFRRQMEFLRRRQIRVVDLDTLLASVTHPSKRDNQVAITFDDGYEDNFRHVHPILKGYKYPWTVFVSVGLIGTDAQIPAEDRCAGCRLHGAASAFVYGNVPPV